MSIDNNFTLMYLHDNAVCFFFCSHSLAAPSQSTSSPSFQQQQIQAQPRITIITRSHAVPTQIQPPDDVPSTDFWKVPLNYKSFKGKKKILFILFFPSENKGIWFFEEKVFKNFSWLVKVTQVVICCNNRYEFSI